VTPLLMGSEGNPDASGPPEELLEKREGIEGLFQVSAHLGLVSLGEFLKFARIKSSRIPSRLFDNHLVARIVVKHAVHVAFLTAPGPRVARAKKPSAQ
jgi:hypothetical protein